MKTEKPSVLFLAFLSPIISIYATLLVHKFIGDCIAEAVAETEKEGCCLAAVSSRTMINVMTMKFVIRSCIIFFFQDAFVCP